MDKQTTEATAIQDRDPSNRNVTASTDDPTNYIPPLAEDETKDEFAGVSLRQFAEVNRELQNHNYDQRKAPDIAASRGISIENWQIATEGWNEKINSDHLVAQRFNIYYLAYRT